MVSSPLQLPAYCTVMGAGFFGGGNQGALQAVIKAKAGFTSTLALTYYSTGPVSRTHQFGALLVAKPWVDSATVTATQAGQINVINLGLDGSSLTDNRGAVIHGMMLYTWKNEIRGNMIINCTGHGIWLNSQRKDGSYSGNLVDPRITDNEVRSSGTGNATYLAGDGTTNRYFDDYRIGSLHGSLDSAGGGEGSPITDGYLLRNVSSFPRGSAFEITSGGGWLIQGNHSNSAGRSGIFANGTLATRILDNFLDGWGYNVPASAGNIYNVFLTVGGSSTVGASDPATIRGNQSRWRAIVGSSSGNTFYHYGLTGAANSTSNGPSVADLSHNKAMLKPGADPSLVYGIRVAASSGVCVFSLVANYVQANSVVAVFPTLTLTDITLTQTANSWQTGYGHEYDVTDPAYRVTQGAQDCVYTFGAVTLYLSLTAAIAAAADAGGGILVFPDGLYTLVTSPLIGATQHNLTFRGSPNAVINYTAATKIGSYRYGLYSAGALVRDNSTLRNQILGTSVPLDANATAGLYSVTVTAPNIVTAGIAADDYVLVGTTAADYYPYAGSQDTARGEIKRIRSVSGTTVTFDDALYDSYTTANSAFIRKVSFTRNITVQGLTFQGGNTPGDGSQALVLDYVDGFRVTDCNFDGADTYSVACEASIRGEIKGCRARDAFYDGVTGSNFYGYYLGDSTQWVRVIGNHSERVRHHTTLASHGAGQYYWGTPRFITVAGNVAKDCMGGDSGRSWAYEHHGQGRDVVFDGNVADGCYGGFVTRGPGVVWANGIIRNWYERAIELHINIVDASDIQIRGGYISARTAEGGGSASPRAIYGDLSNVTTLRNVTIEGVEIEHDKIGQPAVDIAGAISAPGLTIRGLKITTTVTPTVWLIQVTPDRMTVRDCEFVESPYGIRCYGTAQKIIGNQAVCTTPASAGELVYTAKANTTIRANVSDGLASCWHAVAGATGLIALDNLARNHDTYPFNIANGLTGRLVKRNVGDDLSSVASASTITLPNPNGGTAEKNVVTGTTTIQNITAVQHDDTVTLLFSSAACTVHDRNGGAPGNVYLTQGDYVSTATGVLRLYSDGTNWYEVGRSPQRPTDIEAGVTGSKGAGKGWLWDGSVYVWTDLATQAELDAVTVWTTKGDLAAGTGAATAARLAAGANLTQALVADSSQSTGLKWIADKVSRSADSGAVNSGNTGTTLTNDDTLLWAVAANEIWFFQAFLLVNAANATMDVKVGFSVPAAATMSWAAISTFSSSLAGFTAFTAASTPTGVNSESQSELTATINGTVPAAYAGWAFIAGTAGNVTLQWAQNTADAGNLKLLKGSCLFLSRLA